MFSAEVPENILEGFAYVDGAGVRSKIQTFAAVGAQALHVVSDFDLTLTSGKVPGQNLGTWDVMDELMPPEGVQKHTEIYQSFRPIEIAGKLTPEIALEKWSETLDLITGYRMNMREVEAAFLAVAQLRDGAKDVFDVCQTEQIPTVVLSSGIRNVITLMAEYYGIQPDFILSNDLTTSADGDVTGWESDSLIHMLNKNERGHQELAMLRAKRPNVLLLGDVPDDTKMVMGDDVIRVRVLDPRRGETHIPEVALQASFKAGYDLVVEHSLQPVATLVRYLTQKA